MAKSSMPRRCQDSLLSLSSLHGHGVYLSPRDNIGHSSVGFLPYAPTESSDNS
jgi:hypothetical protein